MKVCNVCRKKLPLDAFARSRASRDGRAYTCKRCSTERVKRWRERPGTRDKGRLSNEARRRAIEALAARHPVEFALLVDDEREKAGLTPLNYEAAS